MRKNILIIILIFLTILFSCRKKSKFNLDHYELGKLYKCKNDIFSFFTVFSSNIGSYTFVNNKYIVLERVTKYMSTAGVIYEMNNKLELKELKRIPFGKGPGEGIALTDILFLDNKYYIFDKSMHRFLIYDEMFNYIDTYNLNRPIPVSTFFKFNGSLYAIEGKIEKMIFYKLTFDKKLKLKKEYEFEYEKARSNEKYVKHNRSYVSVLKDTDKYFITKTFNLICYFKKKDKIIKDREIYMGYKESGETGIWEPGIIYLDSDKNFLYRIKNYKYYDYRYNNIKKLNSEEFDVRFSLQFKNKIYHVTYKDGESNIYLKEKKSKKEIQ